MGVLLWFDLKNDASFFKIPEANDLHSCSFLRTVHNPPELSITFVKPVFSAPLTLCIDYMCGLVEIE